MRPASALGGTRTGTHPRQDRGQFVYVPGTAPCLGPPKTLESTRTVSIPKFVTDALAAHLAAFPAGGDGLTFRAAKAGPILRTTLAGCWQQTLRRAKLPPTLHLHHLRHGYASVTPGECRSRQSWSCSDTLHRGSPGRRTRIGLMGGIGRVRNVLETAWSENPEDSADSVRTDEAF